MSIPDFVAFRLRKMRQDAREEVAREIHRQIASDNGAIGPFQMYAQLERAATEGYAEAVRNVARFLLTVKGDAATLDRLTIELAADVLDELEWRRSRLKVDGTLFDGLIRRVRIAVEKTRRVVVAEFHHSLVEGRPWPP
jgi:hypothetical protein